MSPKEPPLSESTENARRTLLRENIRETAVPDNTGSHAEKSFMLKICNDQLVDVVTNIFDILLSQGRVIACFKIATIVPQKSAVPENYHPVVPTQILTKCFEKLVIQHIKISIQVSVHPYLFLDLFGLNAEDAVSTALHSVLTYL